MNREPYICLRAKLSLLVFIALICAGFAGPQEYRAKVQGLVTGSNQAAAVGAKVTLSNVNTGLETFQQTDATGAYLFDFVQPGTYTIVDAAGFNKFVQENISVLKRGGVTVNAQLRIGGVSETVTVAEAAATVQFNTSTNVQGTCYRVFRPVQPTNHWWREGGIGWSLRS